MNKEPAEKWVAALRSGKYKQVTGALRRGEGYCCLGVLCEISRLGQWRDCGYDSSASACLSTAFLTPEVRHWAGISRRPLSAGKGTEIRLSDMNDAGATFKQIADVIEQEWESL